ncbi:hypothetical protein D9M69_676660 [compost metagenome]
MLAQVVQRAGCAVFQQIPRARTVDHAVFAERTRNQAGVGQLADAQHAVESLGHQIDPAVDTGQLDVQRRVFG